MMMIGQFETIDEVIENLSLSDTWYDIEAMRFDYENGNFSLDCPDVEEYYTPNIVANSFMNGQFRQAATQYYGFGLSTSDLHDYLDNEQIARFSAYL